MKLVVTSDTHGCFPNIPTCDIVIIAGDMFPGKYDRDIEAQSRWYDKKLKPWIEALPCRYVVIVPGNHDYYWEKIFEEVNDPIPNINSKEIVLCNCGVELMGLKIYGTPNIPPPLRNFAFSQTEQELKATFKQIPNHIDILISHAAPYGVGGLGEMEDGDIGCKELTEAIADKKIRYLFCGHIHNGNHEKVEWQGKILYNVSYCDNNKEPKYDVLEIEL